MPLKMASCRPVTVVSSFGFLESFFFFTLLLSAASIGNETTATTTTTRSATPVPDSENGWPIDSVAVSFSAQWYSLEKMSALLRTLSEKPTIKKKWERKKRKKKKTPFLFFLRLLPIKVPSSTLGSFLIVFFFFIRIYVSFYFYLFLHLLFLSPRCVRHQLCNLFTPLTTYIHVHTHQIIIIIMSSLCFRL